MKAHIGAGVVWRSLRPLIAVIVAGLPSTACADAPQRARPELEPAGTATDCATLWTTVRGSAVASGIDDGEARRLADQARVECESANGGVTGVDRVADAACGMDASARNAVPTDGDPKVVGVYLSCEADAAVLGTPQQPVYLAIREIPGSLTGSEAEQLEGAVRAYFAGPTLEEQSDGYSSAGPPSLGAAIKNVRIRRTSATIDFSADAGDQVGNLGTSTATAIFMIELSATVFQFEGVDEVTLQVEGDCERFWHLMEFDCVVLQR